MALTKIDDRGLKTPIDLLDNEKIRLGTGNDLQIYHNGTDTYIDNTNGELFIKTTTKFNLRSDNNEAMIVGTPNGAVELKYDNSTKFETTSGGSQATGLLRTNNLMIDGSSGYLSVPDGRTAYFGTGDDLRIFHDGTNSFIQNDTGNFVIASNRGTYNGGEIWIDPLNGERSAKFTPNGAASLYYDNSKKLETSNGGVNITGELNVTTKVAYPDNAKAIFGNGDDLQIYYNGTESWIKNNTGTLNFLNDGTTQIKNNADNETIAQFVSNNECSLYYDNSKKFETTSSGATVSVSSGDPQLVVTGPGHAQLTLTNTSGSDHTGVNFGDSSDHNAGMIQYTNSSNAMQFHTNGSERMHIENSGNIIIGGTSANAQQAITLAPSASNGAGRITFNRANTSNVSIVLRMQNDGSQVGRLEHDHTGTALVSGSDYRLKENDVAISDGIIRLKKLRPIRFNWKNEPSKTVDGFFAHEISSVVPEAVSGEKDAVDSDGNIIMQGISKERLVPLLTAALQEAVGKIETLETKVAALEAA